MFVLNRPCILNVELRKNGVTFRTNETLQKSHGKYNRALPTVFLCMAQVSPKIIAWIWSQGWIQKGGELPSAHKIAEAYGVSIRQVLRALHEFAALGILEIQPGGRIAVVSANPSNTLQSKPQPPAEIFVAEKLRNGIAEGKFRVGEPLPKATWLCMDWKISTRSLAFACRRLAREQLLRKQGKSWIVGAAPTHKPSAPATSRNAIVVVCNRPREWAEFHSNLLDDMARTFEMEANRLGVRLIPVLTGAEEVAQVFPHGRTQIRRCIQELGASFRGIFLTPRLDDLPEFDDWCTWLSGFNAPVVWMQDYDPNRPPPLAAQKIYRISYGAWVDASMLTEADLAMQALHEKGHRDVVFACNDPKVYHWFRLRATELRKRAEKFGMTLHCIEKNVSDQALMKLVLATPKATALLAPNDRFAVRYWQVLAEQGVRIPRDLSMVSFDNLADLHPFPISSVDFGMATLGYQAFHLLLGDVPVHAHKGRHLMGVSRLVDNGSIAKPRSQRKLHDNIAP